jgi:hypothetical protein
LFKFVDKCLFCLFHLSIICFLNGQTLFSKNKQKKDANRFVAYYL